MSDSGGWLLKRKSIRTRDTLRYSKRFSTIGRGSASRFRPRFRFCWSFSRSSLLILLCNGFRPTVWRCSFLSRRAWCWRVSFDSSFRECCLCAIPKARDRKSTPSELQSRLHLVCRLLLEKKKKKKLRQLSLKQKKKHITEIQTKHYK